MGNGYHGDEKKPNMVFGQTNSWDYQSKTWNANTNSLWEYHGLGPTWPHLFPSLFKAKKGKNGISADTLQPKGLDP